MNKTQAFEKFRNLPNTFESFYRDYDIDPAIVDLGFAINAIDVMRSVDSCQHHLFSVEFPLAWKAFDLDWDIIKKVNAYYEQIQKPFVYSYGGYFYFSIIPAETSMKIQNTIRNFCETNDIFEFIDVSKVNAIASKQASCEIKGLSSQLKDFKAFPAQGQRFYSSRSPFTDLDAQTRIELSKHIEDFVILVKDFEGAKDLRLDEIIGESLFLYEDKAIESQKKVLKGWLELAKIVLNIAPPNLNQVSKIDDYDSLYWKHLIKDYKNSTKEINVGLLIECA